MSEVVIKAHDERVSVGVIPADKPVPAPWSQALRIGFRFSFSYWALYAVLNGNATLVSAIPVVGTAIQRALATPGAALAQWLGTHVFHLSGVASRWHGGGSGDTTLHYLQVLVFAVGAVLSTVIWSALDWRRPDYRTLLVWLRWFLRLSLGIAMLVYGFAKLFPLQMRPPSLGILNNTFGNSSPMTLLWTLIGLNPVYQMICGAAEVAGGMLLLFRRTATVGTVVTLFVVTNVVLYNFCFDVPVKLYASHLLLMSGFLLLPDLRAFAQFFVGDGPAQRAGAWLPSFSRPRVRQVVMISEAAFAIAMLLSLTFYTDRNWYQHVAARAPTPIFGAWQVDEIETEVVSARPVSPEGEPWVALYIDDRRAGFYRSRDGALWRCGFVYDERKQKLRIRSVSVNAEYAWERPEPDQLILTRMVDGKPVKITFRRTGTQDGFPLLQRGFHWISEWGYER